MSIGFFFKAVLAVCFILPAVALAQDTPPKDNLVYVDKQGVLRWTKTNKEAAFFGVNYTVPFAYSYRAHKALNVDLEKAIDQDVYHMARLGLDAFRVHVWDTEITDSLGNLLENDHLRLFDFLLAALEKRHIKVIMTPIAFWGNGYPQRDERTPGFSRVFGKGRATSNDTAIRAQENYLQQLFRHVNAYTHRTYVADPSVIAVELNNEPSHSGPKSGVTAYINRLAAAIRSVGWTKPLYYNISQSPYYADAVAKANIDGVSFQWYPTGLVAGAMQKGNYLPNVDKYVIPYDTIPEFRNKSRMVYEFETADVLQSDLYPAVARSFRTAGFQWVTQFAYDPMALAYANSEYQTHYLSLPYTPSKAISILIASEAFHAVPRLKSYGAYPADTLFDAFHVSYREELSEMNTTGKFFYTNNTTTVPVNAAALTNVAGVGNSPVVHYKGSGAYFLDKIEEGVWRLEVMPDVVQLRDPFERASPDKEVSRVQWDSNAMQVLLPDLGKTFTIQGLNEGNNYSGVSGAEGFVVRPGTFILTGTGKKMTPGKENGPVNSWNGGVIGMKEFAAPEPYSTNLSLHHEPLMEVSAGKSFTISAQVVGLDTGNAFVQISRVGGRQPRMIPMVRNTATSFTAVIPADLVTPGALTYRIILQQGDVFAEFPGGWKESPFAWNSYHDDTWKTYVAADNGRLIIFDPTEDQTAWIYPGFRRNFQSAYVTGEMSGHLILRLAATEISGDHTIGCQVGFTEKGKGRQSERGSFDKLMIRAKTEESQPVKAKITLTDGNGFSYATAITLTNDFRDIEIPLQQMTPDSAWVMPRPYPGFQPLWFAAAGTPPPFVLGNMEKIQVTLGSDVTPNAFHQPYSLDIATIWFEKSK